MSEVHRPETVVADAVRNLLVKFSCTLYGTMTAPEEDVIGLGSLIDTASTGPALAEYTRNLATFIESAEVAAVVQSFLMLKATEKSHSEAAKTLLLLRNAFKQLALTWENELQRPLGGPYDAIWNTILANFELIGPVDGSSSRLSENELKRLMEAATNAAQKGLPPVPKYIRQVIEATSSPSIVEDLRRVCSDISSAVLEAESEMHLEHAQERHRFGYEDLYVERTVTARDSLNSSLSAVFANPTPGVRLVVVGDPGAGKSTLMSRLVNRAASCSGYNLAPILVRCREYAGDSDVSLMEMLTRSLLKHYDLTVERANMERLLAVGRAFLIFDGIDEVTDIGQRRRLTTAIERLAHTYPFAGAICTTRKVGYEAARFVEALFPTFDLHEYSDSQVAEYAVKWFKVMGRPALDCSAFLKESEEVEDIRRNPLMLSLLCTLYRVRGYLPMNQRDVYKQCADLLFHSWDALRHIPQPVDHKRYGHTLMEELADFFFKFPPVAGGVEEGQLTRLIATFFVDTAGVEPAEARPRAESFLEFCAGRAWLLSAVGHTSRGERVFSFTHRTFMEYYAAEAIVRRASNHEDVLTSMLDAYRKNPSSVLPDLMFQAYEDKSYRGAETLLRDLMREGKAGRRVASGKHIPLCLRVLNSTPVGARLVAEVLAQAFESWRKISPETKEQRKEFISLLQLYRDPRTICYRLLAEPGYASLEIEAAVKSHGGRWTHLEEIDVERVRSDFRQAFLARWARLWFSGDAEVYIDDWSAIVDDIANVEAGGAGSFDPVVRSYLVDRGKVSLQSYTIANAPLVLNCYESAEPGLVPSALVQVLVGVRPSDIQENLLRQLDTTLTPKALHVPFDEAAQLNRCLGSLFRYLQKARPDVNFSIKDRPFLVPAIWIGFVSAEGKPGSLSVFLDVLNDQLGDDFIVRSLRTRLGRTAGGEASNEISKASPFTATELAELSLTYPIWVRRWVTRRLNLTR